MNLFILSYSKNGVNIEIDSQYKTNISGVNTGTGVSIVIINYFNVTTIVI